MDLIIFSMRACNFWITVQPSGAKPLEENKKKYIYSAETD